MRAVFAPALAPGALTSAPERQPPRLLLFPGDTTDAAVQHAIALLISVSAELAFHYTTKYAALALLAGACARGARRAAARAARCELAGFRARARVFVRAAPASPPPSELRLPADRALPLLLQEPAAVDGAAPAVMPLALACALVASKLSDRSHVLISELLASAAAVEPGFEQRCGGAAAAGAAVRAAELWLMTRVESTHVGRLASDFVAEMLAALRCAVRAQPLPHPR
jgi:hypothetical protein